jgi:hypothetical protein
MSLPSLRSWGYCIDCHYEGILDYRPLMGERYSDSEGAAVVLLLICPACGSQEHTLMPRSYFLQILAEQASDEDSGER